MQFLKRKIIENEFSHFVRILWFVSFICSTKNENENEIVLQSLFQISNVNVAFLLLLRFQLIFECECIL